MEFKRDYYPLNQAAEMLNHSEDDLIYLGAKGVVGIGILVGNAITLKQVINSKGICVEETIGPFPGQSVKLHTYCLKDCEAGIEDTEVILAIYFKDRPNGNSEVIKIIDKKTGKPLLIKNCKLIIYKEDIAKQMKGVYLLPIEQLLKSLNDYSESDIFKKAESKKLPRVLSLMEITGLFVSCYPKEQKNKHARDFIKAICQGCKEKLLRPYIDEIEPAITHFTCMSTVDKPLAALAHVWISEATQFEDNEFKHFLTIMGILPLPEKCLLNNWWDDKQVGVYKKENKLEVNEKFIKFKNLQTREVSIIMDENNATMIIRGSKIDVIPEDLGLSSGVIGWKYLLGASVNLGGLDRTLERGNKTSDREIEKNKVKTNISRLNKTLKQHMGLDQKPIRYINKSGYQFIFKEMKYKPLYGENITLSGDAMDHLDKTSFNEESHDQGFWRDNDQEF